jgi:hypothetical protein
MVASWKNAGGGAGVSSSRRRIAKLSVSLLNISGGIVKASINRRRNEIAGRESKHRRVIARRLSSSPLYHIFMGGEEKRRKSPVMDIVETMKGEARNV